MAKQSSKQPSSSKSKGSSNKKSSGQSSSSSTVPVNRSWQNQSLDRSQTGAGGSDSYGVGRWLTEPSWQEPFNAIAEVPAAGSAAGCVGGRQGSGASATYATSRTQQQQQQQQQQR
ncbi:hypothetical protein CH063_11197 [Colletotrichum higginsianum]|uniref:Uncharacterized protein n=2 Tax=Colletotrichum higginsianum TaxID=80884 RepID=H1VKE9_COLHI|nr:hypothetical protein CH63R_11241 [Colletotrichum higginsianum IMI 349063]OBR04538.1 hypothetical protein CH63R_11241 [Colletotrichum higginsianum IMI 349063]TIC89677.1 hypothetical protein CH35J_012561 [Colletotrichum higginsianum]GJC99176.1 hypothetical protein ColKHC_08002 [Colletotrichum higginsianum]CCF40702.1 hypothetical protein CH063_11197 [Colletotrichum higginsianum]